MCVLILDDFDTEIQTYHPHLWDYTQAFKQHNAAVMNNLI